MIYYFAKLLFVKRWALGDDKDGMRVYIVIKWRFSLLTFQ